MNLPLVSILVPIYGVEKYIERCAESLFSQSYENIEYIFVNDCTKDRSIEILEDVVRRYPCREDQVKIINHNRNRGLAAARNTGIENAHGEFILWVDSDDFVDPCVVEKLICKQREKNADVVCCDVYLCYDGYKKISRNSYEENPKSYIKKILLGQEKCWIWGKLIRRSLYEKNDIRVEEGCNMAEDFQVFPRLLYYSVVVDYLKEPLCYYECTNLSSYCKTVNEKQKMQQWRSYDIVYSFFKDTQLNVYLGYTAADIVYFHLKSFLLKDGLSESFFFMVKNRWTNIPFASKTKLPLKRFLFSNVCLFLGPNLLKKIRGCFFKKG